MFVIGPNVSFDAGRQICTTELNDELQTAHTRTRNLTPTYSSDKQFLETPSEPNTPTAAGTHVENNNPAASTDCCKQLCVLEQ